MTIGLIDSGNSRQKVVKDENLMRNFREAVINGQARLGMEYAYRLIEIQQTQINDLKAEIQSLKKEVLDQEEVKVDVPTQPKAPRKRPAKAVKQDPEPLVSEDRGSDSDVSDD